MQRYFLKQDNGMFDKDDAHHLISVMRAKKNDQVIVCHNNLCHLARINIQDRTVSYQKLEVLPQQNSLDITVIQGLPKGSKVDLICKTATIFGASHILFTPMKRSIAKLANETAKLDRLYKIVKEAAELAHRQNMPTIGFENSLKSINWKAFDLIILADEEAKDIKIKDLAMLNESVSIAIVIGPEGGIDPAERILLLEKKAVLVTLGTLIIPTELAHIAMLNNIYQIKS